MLASLVRSTPLRTTLILAAAFVLAMLAAGVVAWQLLSRDLSARLDDSIREDFAVIRQTFGDSDITDLCDSVAIHVSATVAFNRVYLLRGPGTPLRQPAKPEGPIPTPCLPLAGREGRGKLTVFLGAAPGVGKTCAILGRPQRLKAKGCRHRGGSGEDQAGPRPGRY
jgi:hypothetical protein